MDLATATTAADLAAKITARNEAMALIQRAMAEGWVVTNFRATSPDGANDMALILSPLDVATSQQALGFTIQVYQAQIAALNAQLATL